MSEIEVVDVPVPGNGKNSMRLCIEGVGRLKRKWYLNRMDAQSICGLNSINNYVGNIGDPIYTPIGDKLTDIADYYNPEDEDSSSSGIFRWILGPEGWDGKQLTRTQMESQQGLVFVTLTSTHKKMELKEFLKMSGADLRMYPAPVPRNLYLTNDTEDKLIAHYRATPGIDLSDPDIYTDDVLWIPNRWIKIGGGGTDNNSKELKQKNIPCILLEDMLNSKNKKLMKSVSTLKMSFYPPGIVRSFRLTPVIPDKYKFGIIEINKATGQKVDLRNIAQEIGILESHHHLSKLEDSGVTIVAIPCKWTCETVLRNPETIYNMLDMILRLDESRPENNILSETDVSKCNILFYDGHYLTIYGDNFQTKRVEDNDFCSEILFIRILNGPYSVSNSDVEDNNISLNPFAKEPLIATLSPLPMIIQAYCVQFVLAESEKSNNPNFDAVNFRELVPSTLQENKYSMDDGISKVRYSDRDPDSDSFSIELKVLPGATMKAEMDLAESAASAKSEAESAESIEEMAVSGSQLTEIPFGISELKQCIEESKNWESLWGFIGSFIRCFDMSHNYNLTLNTLKSPEFISQFSRAHIIGGIDFEDIQAQNTSRLMMPSRSHIINNNSGEQIVDMDNYLHESDFEAAIPYERVKSDKLCNAFWALCDNTDLNDPKCRENLMDALTPLIIRKALLSKISHEAASSSSKRVIIVQERGDTLKYKDSQILGKKFRDLTPYEILRLVDNSGGTCYYKIFLHELLKLFGLDPLTSVFDFFKTHYSIVSKSTHTEIQIDEFIKVRKLDSDTEKPTAVLKGVEQIFKAIKKEEEVPDVDDSAAANAASSETLNFVETRAKFAQDKLRKEGYFSTDPFLNDEKKILGSLSPLPHRSLITSLICGTVPLEMIPPKLSWIMENSNTLSVRYDPENGKYMFDYGTMILCIIMGMMFKDRDSDKLVPLPNSRKQFKKCVKQIRKIVKNVSHRMILSCGLVSGDFVPNKEHQIKNHLLLAAWLCALYLEVRVCFLVNGIFYDLVGVFRSDDDEESARVHKHKTTICVEIEPVSSTDIGYAKAIIISNTSDAFLDSLISVHRAYSIGDFHMSPQMIEVNVEKTSKGFGGGAGSQTLLYSFKNEEKKIYTKKMMNRINTLLDILDANISSPSITLENIFDIGFCEDDQSLETFILCGFRDNNNDVILVPTICLNGGDPIMMRRRMEYIPPYYSISSVTTAELRNIAYSSSTPPEEHHITHLIFKRDTSIYNFRKDLFKRVVYRRPTRK